MDNNESLRESTAEILALAGYEVSQASGPDQALDQLGGGNIDLLLLDLGLEGQGLQVLEDATNLPIVIGTSGSKREFSDPRVCAFLPKPFAPDLLLAEVVRWLSA